MNARTTVFLLMWMPTALHADPLRITVGPGRAFAGYTRVTLGDAANQPRFSGLTDRLGRINIALPAGNYHLTATVQGRSYRAEIQLTGQTSPQTVTLQ